MQTPTIKKKQPTIGFDHLVLCCCSTQNRRYIWKQCCSHFRLNVAVFFLSRLAENNRVRASCITSAHIIYIIVMIWQKFSNKSLQVIHLPMHAVVVSDFDMNMKNSYLWYGTYWILVYCHSWHYTHILYRVDVGFIHVCTENFTFECEHFLTTSK